MSLKSPIHTLIKEELNVLQQVRSARASGLKPSTKLTEDIFVKGAIHFFMHPIAISDIPSGEGWRWNQTRKKKELQGDALGEVGTMTKLIPRKSKKTPLDAPPFKLWHLSFEGAGLHSTVLYCERGKPEELTTHSSPLYGSNSALEGEWSQWDFHHDDGPNDKMAISFLCS